MVNYHDAVAADVTWEEEEEEGSSVADATSEEGQAEGTMMERHAFHATMTGNGAALLRRQQ
jgi:hypothetical protein